MLLHAGSYAAADRINARINSQKRREAAASLLPVPVFMILPCLDEIVLPDHLFQSRTVSVMSLTIRKNRLSEIKLSHGAMIARQYTEQFPVAHVSNRG